MSTNEKLFPGDEVVPAQPEMAAEQEVSSEVERSVELEAAPIVTFSPTRVKILTNGAKVKCLDLTIDGACSSFVPQLNSGWLVVPLPSFVRDTYEHIVSINVEVGGRTYLQTSSVRSDYVGNLDAASGSLVGWIYDKSEPEVAVDLSISLDDYDVINETAAAERVDVSGAGHPTTRCGFSIPLPDQRSLLKSRHIEIYIAGTDYRPFGVYLDGIGSSQYLHAFSNASMARRDPLLDSILRPLIASALRVEDGILKQQILPVGIKQVAPPGHSHRGNIVVDVVIPVYRGREETLACIESVINGRGSIPYRIVAIFDCGPEQELLEDLVNLRQQGLIDLLENNNNMGFVASVNRGMEYSTCNDVVLLNSDTLVPPLWLDRLYYAAYKDQRTGTVTAVSNNATICSIPAIGGSSLLPFGADLQTIDRVCQEKNSGVTVELPTAHGFCMYIKRDTISDVGLFDVEAFGKGYGEENDFSLRAAANGWRNVAACDVFVQHLGSVSFGVDSLGLTARNLEIIAGRYPDFHRQVMDFIYNDPMSEVRNRVQLAFWANKKVVVMISLRIGGGVARHIEESARMLVADGYFPLLLTRGEPGSRQAYVIKTLAEDESGELRFPEGPDALVKAFSDLISISPIALHVHHQLDLSPGVTDLIRNSGVPFQVVLHDFFHVCPRVTLLDSRSQYCGLPSSSKCTRCIKRNGSHEALDSRFASLATDTSKWRRYWGDFLAEASEVIAPSESTAELHRRVFPKLEISVVPHEDIHEVPASSRETPSSCIRVAIIGAIGPHKGLAKLLDLLSYAERWAEEIEFFMIGFSAHDEALLSFSNIQITGAYQPHELEQKIADANCSLALFLSPWPETYSYTLSEALSAGLTPVVLDHGAPAERLRALQHGEVCPVDATAADIVNALLRAETLEARRFQLFASKTKVTSRSLAPASELRLLGTPAGLYHDKWLARRTMWYFSGTQPVERVSIDLYTTSRFAGMHVNVLLNGLHQMRKAVRPEELTRLTLEVQITNGLIGIELEFDFDGLIAPNDKRYASAILHGLSFSDGSGEVFRVP